MYINGTEVVRSNMPTGTITTNTLAPVAIDGANETTVLPVQRAAGRARRRHQHASRSRSTRTRVASSDISFDLALDAEVNGGGGGDITTPSAPAGLTVGTVTANSVALSWQASTDNVGVDHYTVLRNGVPVGHDRH